MKFIVIYAHKEGYGNCDMYMENDRPTIEEIREAEKKLSKKHKVKQVVILNWKRLREE